MAKQNVSFAERHLEKFMVGAAGAVLLGVVVYYGFMGPNAVTVAGQALGPKDFFQELKSKTDGGKASIKNRKPDPLGPLPHLINRVKGGPMALTALGFAPSANIPTVGGSDMPGDQVLAEILPPKSLSAKAGLAFVALPPMDIIRPGSGPGPSASSNNNSPPLPSDQLWVLVTAGLDRKAQKEKFLEAKYPEDRSQLIAASLVAERRELGPDGRWSEPVLIRPGQEAFAQQVIAGEARVKPKMVDDRPTLDDADSAYVPGYRAQLYSPEAQSLVLRPPFQTAMIGEAKWQLAWQPPKKLKDFDFKLSDFGVSFPVEGEKKPTHVTPQPNQPQPPVGPGPRERAKQPGPQQPQPGLGGPKGSVDLAAQKRARDGIANAEKAAKDGDWKKFLETIEPVLSDPTTPEKEHKKALELREQYDLEVKTWQKEQAGIENREKDLGIVKLGEDQEPVWLTDIKVEPGKTYQYRLRVIAYNEYAGMFTLVKDRADAEKVLIEGQWSEWSEPVTVPNTSQLFFTDVRDEAGVKKARVTVWSWQRGEWQEGKHEVEVGEPVNFADGKWKFSYDGIVTGLEGADKGREYRGRNAKGAYEPPVKTEVLTLVSAAGQVEERLAAEDKVKNNAYRAWVKEYHDLLASTIQPPTARANLGGDFVRQPQGPMGGPMGPMGPGGYDPRMGGRGGFDPRMGGRGRPGFGGGRGYPPGGPGGTGGPGYGPRPGG